MKPKIKPFALVILDGWGHREEREHNSIAEAKTPFFDYLWKTYPHSLLDASEESVGLPSGQIGNSEVGHMTIGAGRIIDTDLVRITKAMHLGKFGKNPAFQKLFAHCLDNNSTLHIIGLLSPGGVHSHSEHLYGFLRVAKEAGVSQVAMHAVTDGRDTPPTSGVQCLLELENFLKEIGIGRIASVAGRFYTMDRDNNWHRLERALEVMFRGSGTVIKNLQPSEYIRKQYADGAIDEHLEPVAFEDKDGIQSILRPNDGIFIFNFRADRVRMLSKKILERGKKENICLITMTEYEKNSDALVAYTTIHISTTLASVLSEAGLIQAHIAETEKHPHVTYFLNGGRKEPHAGEYHLMIPSRKDVATHDLAPEMRAREITDSAIECVRKGTDFIILNYANADMVGHTANKPAIVKAVETVDHELKRLVEAVQKAGGALFITADHGNAETNVDSVTGEKHTAHTTNLVPAILTCSRGVMKNGTLADVTTTILSLIGLPISAEMTGKNLYSDK